jgi:hypothetical protein
MLCVGGRVKSTSPPYPRPTPGPVTEGPIQSQVVSTRNMGKTLKSSQPKPNDLVSPPQTKQSPIEEVFDLCDSLPLDACVELTYQILTSAPTLPSGSACSLAVPKIVLFLAEYDSTAQTDKPG